MILKTKNTMRVSYLNRRFGELRNFRLQYYLLCATSKNNSGLSLYVTGKIIWGYLLLNFQNKGHVR